MATYKDNFEHNYDTATRTAIKSLTSVQLNLVWKFIIIKLIFKFRFNKKDEIAFRESYSIILQSSASTPLNSTST